MPPHMSVTYVEVSSAGPFLPTHDVLLRPGSTLMLRWLEGVPTDTITMEQVRFAIATRPSILDFAESSIHVVREAHIVIFARTMFTIEDIQNRRH